MWKLWNCWKRKRRGSLITQSRRRVMIFSHRLARDHSWSRTVLHGAVTMPTDIMAHVFFGVEFKSYEHLPKFITLLLKESWTLFFSGECLVGNSWEKSEVLSITAQELEKSHYKRHDLLCGLLISMVKVLNARQRRLYIVTRTNKLVYLDDMW